MTIPTDMAGTCPELKDGDGDAWIDGSMHEVWTYDSVMAFASSLADYKVQIALANATKQVSDPTEAY